MKASFWAAALLATPLLASNGHSARAAFTVQTVTDPSGNNFINLLGINDSETIVGSYNATTPNGFMLTLPSTFSAENVPGTTSTIVTAINNNGDTAGIFTTADGNTHGFTRIGNTFAAVDDPAGPAFNQALGINNAGTTVGYYANSQAGTNGQTAYSQSHGVFTNINNLLPANSNSQAVGINNTGAIVGFFQPSPTTSVGFLDVGGTIQGLDPFGSTFTQALGINDLGEIVGFYTDGSNVQHGYLDNGGIFTSFDPTGSVSTTINGINDLGQFVGFYTDGNDHTVGFVASNAIPEPAAPIAVAICGLIAARYRRRAEA